MLGSLNYIYSACIAVIFKIIEIKARIKKKELQQIISFVFIQWNSFSLSYCSQGGTATGVWGRKYILPQAHDLLLMHLKSSPYVRRIK